MYVSFGGLGAKKEEGTLAASCVKARGFGQDLGTSSFEISEWFGTSGVVLWG